MTTKITPATREQKKDLEFRTLSHTRAALREVKPSSDGMNQLFKNGDKWKKYIVDGLCRFTAKLPDYALAAKILGTNFVKPEEIAKARDIVYPESMLLAYVNSLPSEEDLVWCRDNKMILVPGPEKPRAALSIRDLDPAQFYSKTGGWYADDAQKFSREDAAVPAWLAFQKGAVDGSFNLRWERQEPLVKAPAFVPKLGRGLWAVTSFKAVRDIDLLPDFYVRTSSVSADGFRVYFGHSLDGGLDVSYWSDAGLSVGVAAAREWALKA